MSPRPFNPLGFLAVRDPRVRVGALVIMLLLVIAGMVFLNRVASRPPEREIAEVPSVEVTEAPSGIPALDMDIAKDLTDYGQEARRRWPQEALRYLLLETANTPAVYSYQRNLLPITPGSAAEIEKDSRPWRFKYVRFRGELEYIEEEDYESLYGSPAPCEHVWRGRVRLSDGDPPLRVVFVTVRGPMWADPNKPGPLEYEEIKDGWVRGHGILVQNYVDERGGDVPALLVVATSVERDFEALPVRSLDDIPFDIIRDDPAIANEEGGLAELGKEYPLPLFRLLRYAEGFTGAAGAERRAKLPALRVHTPKEWEALFGNPKESRGKYVTGSGVIPLPIMRYVPESIPPNDAGIEECLNGWILTDERVLLQFLAPGSFDDFPKGTRVRWAGFFYKTKLYPANNGTRRLAPMFVLTELQEIKIEKSEPLFPVILASSILVAMLLLAWIVLREDSTKENYRRIRQKKVAAGRAAD